MPRRLGENIPQLSDRTQQAYQQVQENMLANFQSASSALSAKAQADNANYQSQIQQWQNQEQRRAYESQGGGGFLQNIAQLGQQIVAGYVLLDEVQARKQAQKEQKALQDEQMQLARDEAALKKQQVEAGIQLDRDQFEYNKEKDARSFQLQEAEVQQRQVLAQQEANQEQEKYNLDTLEKTLTNEIEFQMGEIGKIMQQYGRDAGQEQFESVIASMFQSEAFKMLDPQRQQNVVERMYKVRTELNFNTAIEEFKEQKDVIKTELSLITQQWRYENSEHLQRLMQGFEAGMSYDDASNLAGDLIRNYQSMFSDEKYSNLLRLNKQAGLESMIEVYKIVGQSLEKYVESGVKAETGDYQLIQAANGIALLEQRKLAGDLNDLQFNVEAQRLFNSLGLNTDYKSWSTSMPNRLSQSNDLLEMEQKRRLLLRKDQTLNSVLGDNSPGGDAARRYIVGEYVYQNLDTPDLAINRLKILVEGGMDDGTAATQIELLSSWGKDRDTFLNLEKQQRGITAQIEKLKYVPNSREVVVPPGTPGAPGQGLSTDYDIVNVERDAPLPNTSPEHIEELNKQLEVIQLQKENLVNKWLGYGIDIVRPQNRTYMDKLKGNAQAALDTIDQHATANGVSGRLPDTSSVDPAGLGSLRPGDSSVSPGMDGFGGSGGESPMTKVRNAVTYEYRANELKVPKGVFESKVAPQIMDSGSEELISQEFYKLSNTIVSTILNGTEEAARDLITKAGTTLDNKLKEAGLTPLDREGYFQYRQGLHDIYKWARDKKNYYRNRFDQQSRSNTPPSFSSGSTAKRNEVQGIVATVTPEGSLTPALHLKGNLASHPDWGWVPFKGGNVRLGVNEKISGYGHGRGRPHDGIDLISNDPRVATMQGGKVKWVSDTDWGGYGKTVFVETADGHIEMFAHLDSINVKKGQYLQPADVVGIMGNTGASKGAHLHFEVWTNTDWNHPGEISNSQRGHFDPVIYFNRFKGKTTLPQSPGGEKVTGGSGYAYRDRTVAYHTGAIKIGKNLVYYRGFVFDENSNQMRRATPEEQSASKTGVPEIIYRTSRELYRTSTPSGATMRSTVEIPERAEREGTFFMLRPAGYQVGGQDVWNLEGYYNNVRMFNKPVLNPPMGDGDYKITSTYNYSAFANPADKKVVDDFVKRRGSVNMYVRSVARQDLISSAPVSNFKHGAIDARGTLSIDAADYAGFGTGEEDFGYAALRNDPKLRQSVYKTAQALGVPAVWIADQIAMESEWNPNVVNEFGYRGYFQLGNPSLYGITEAEMRDKYRQIESAMVKYHKAIMREVGGYRNFEEFLMGVWGGGRGIEAYRKAGGASPSSQFRYRDAYTDWDGYRRILERKSGRRYNWSGVRMSHWASHYHDSPNQKCPVCNSMTRGGYFTAHLY